MRDDRFHNSQLVQKGKKSRTLEETWAAMTAVTISFPEEVSGTYLSLAKVDVSKIWNLDEGPHPVGGGGTRLLCRAHAHSSGSGCKQVGGVNTY